MIIPCKEKFDEAVIHSAFTKIVDYQMQNMDIHFVYASEYYYYSDRLRSFILKEMTKCNIRKVMMTIISMGRKELITKEKMENYGKGNEFEKFSVNDDLESLFDDLRLGKEPNVYGRTYFLPKLTNEELKLVAKKDLNYMNTFVYQMDADVSKAEMQASKSNSKFVMAICRRETLMLENPPKQKNRLRSVSNAALYNHF